MSEIKLLPCPFCGTKPAMKKHNGLCCVIISCENYGNCINVCAVAGNRLQAVKKWNRRADTKENRADS